MGTLENRHLRVRRRNLSPVAGKIQAIDRDDEMASKGSFGRRRPCDAFSNWRTRIVGTGRLNK
jgi:hypothetical protein